MAITSEVIRTVLLDTSRQGAIKKDIHSHVVWDVQVFCCFNNSVKIAQMKKRFSEEVGAAIDELTVEEDPVNDN